jgi:glyoxylase-like metal-dependent hydrolase (beta-lactamase superfamily II)
MQYIILFTLMFLTIHVSNGAVINNPMIAYGKVVSIQIDDKVTIHHYETSFPILINSYIIELPTKLVIFDAQFILPAANELLVHARSLNKPIDRIVISHSHPDHYFGLEVFTNVAPIYALDETIREIAMTAYYYIGKNKQTLKELVPIYATFPTRVQREVTEIIDGVTFNFMRIQRTEASNTLVMILPAQRSMFVGDLVFNEVHYYLAERNFDSWINTLKDFQRDFLFFNIFQGHGTPTTTLKLQDSIDYLDFAKQAYLLSPNFKAFKTTIVQKYPTYKLDSILDLAENYLYPKQRIFVKG